MDFGFIPWLVAWGVLAGIGLKYTRTRFNRAANVLVTGGIVGIAWLIQYLFHAIASSKSLGLIILGSIAYVFIILPILVIAEIFLIALWLAIMDKL